MDIYYYLLEFVNILNKSGSHGTRKIQEMVQKLPSHCVVANAKTYVQLLI